MLTTGDWIAIISSLSVVAVGFGALRAELRALRERVKELAEELHQSSIRQGERLGALERWQEGVRQAEKERRRLTGAVRTPEQEDS